MKRIIFLLVAISFLTASIVIADEKPSKAKKPFILVTNRSDFTAINGGFADFAKACRKADFGIDHRMLGSIADEDLEGVDIFILAVQPFSLGKDDKAALRRFVRNGGGLLMIAHQNLSDVSNLSSFSQDYGITFKNAPPWHPWKAQILSKSPLRGPKNCSIIGCNSPNGARFNLEVDSKNAEAVARVLEVNEIICAISKHKNLGKGRFAVIGSMMPFYHLFFSLYDNENFCINMMHYLSERFDLTVVLSKFKGKDFLPGKKITVIGKIKNTGTGASNATKVRFLLSDTDTYPVGPPADVITLKTVNLGPIQPNKTKKIKAKAKIPNGIASGEYYLITVVDPEGASGDSNAANNFKASKKKISIK